MISVKPNVNTMKKTLCRYCDAKLSEPFLDLGSMALANSFVSRNDKTSEFFCPLRLTRCSQCSLVQLTHVVPAQIMFAEYLYVSSTTKTFREHFASYAKTVKKMLIQKEKGIAVDIGSNDGLLLSCYKAEGMMPVGVEPAKNLCDLANQNGIRTINRFFNEQCVEEILRNFGSAQVISANNVFAHIDSIQNVCLNVCRLLDHNGMFVIEFPYLVTMMNDLLFDMIYHEHLSYISVNSLSYVLNRFDLEIFSITRVSSHGGSLRVFIQKKNGPYSISGDVNKFKELEKDGGYLSEAGCKRFASQVNEVKRNLIDFVNNFKSEGKSISGYGAAAKANTIINFCGFSASQIDFIVDDNPLKQNLLTPGANIPVTTSAHLFDHPTDYVIIFAWNFAKEIIQKLEELQSKGVRFIIPLPKPHVLG
jgi:SAM-dependent methyltransferase